MQTFLITSFDEDLRLDKLLARRYPGQSRVYFQSLIDQGLILLNGKPPKKRDRPLLGDEVQITFASAPEIALEAENIPLHLLYEDESLIAIDKPSGLVVHPGAGNWSGTFVNALLHHCKSLPEGGVRPGIVHRLDKETSGVLIAAKTKEAQFALSQAFAERKVYKEYLAITVGSPGNVTIDAPIGRSPNDRKKMTVTEKGKRAVTHLHVLKRNEKYALVQAIIETGRTHQIRVHLQHHRTPILGDKLYGTSAADRLMLHAQRLKFTHPITGQPLEILAPPPPQFTKRFAP
ncbi:MAG: RluA family pseudouridine synthase [Verrucomicrobia bacterium]|nr:RluA family pseudouridine synthase [Verrucomicrobiota bacterium]